MHKGNLEKEIAHQVSKLNIQKLGIEENNMTLQQYKNLQKYVQAEMIQVCEIIENIRIIKDTPEIETMKIAANIADEAFHHILTFLKPGISENAVRDELEFSCEKGATSSSFQIIVASGVRSSLPHGVASNKIIERGISLH